MIAAAGAGGATATGWCCCAAVTGGGFAAAAEGVTARDLAIVCVCVCVDGGVSFEMQVRWGRGGGGFVVVVVVVVRCRRHFLGAGRGHNSKLSPIDHEASSQQAAVAGVRRQATRVCSWRTGRLGMGWRAAGRAWGGGVIGQISRDLPLSAHWAEAGSVGSSILVPERREFVVVNQILEPTFFFFDPLPLLSSQDPRTLAIPAEEQAPGFLRAPTHLRIIAYFRLPCQDTTSFCIVSV